MNIKDNLVNGTYTTVLGTIIVMAAMTSVFIPALGIDWTQAGIGMAVGLGVAGFGKK